MKYKKDIEDIAKQVCYCCQNLCFAHQAFYVSKSCIEQFPDVIKSVKFNEHVLICKGCQKKINSKKPLDLMLQDYIN